MTAENVKPGTVVSGPFHSDTSRPGVGIVRDRGRAAWTHVGEGYVPVEIIVGDRARGGYRPEALREVRALKEAR